MMRKTSEEIVKILLSLALKEINALVMASATKLIKEKATLKLAQLQSLISTPPSTIKKLLDRL